MFDGTQEGLVRDSAPRGTQTEEPAEVAIRGIRAALGPSWTMDVITDVLGDCSMVAMRDGLDYAILVNIGLDELSVRFMGPDEVLTFFGKSFHVSGLTSLVERCKATIEACAGTG